ncbi:WD repeat-containing protein 11-like isoform X4 [Acanthaster planci]|uniref:WD repeat-containing protein 11-like isoform X4 n=1 Tax=Acanthaster planci TaxID=133434 RepID=A0A8B7XKU7_ACAPL|nr:WD repeat-containing protein 11-like isoform X4 [Acanthaster planci]
MNIFPRTITGALHGQNKIACDWGWQSLVAYGCHTSVVVVDTKAVQVIQTLEKHKSNVVKVKWARENYHHTIDAPYTLRLATADAGGQIIVWDVKDASDRASFNEGSKPVLDLEWLSTQDASHDLLVALHPPYSIVLWNADTGTKLWKKTFTDNIISMTFDPFDSSNLALLGNDCILFLNDFSITKQPSSNGRKFYITVPGTSGPSPSSSSTNLSGGSDKKIGNRFRRVRLLVGDNKPRNSQLAVEDTDPIALNECLQMTYLQSRRQHLLLVYPREILVLDLDIYQTVGMIPMERSGSPFQQVYPCKQRDVLLCLHENGSISVRVRRRPRPSTSPSTATPVDQIGNFVGLTGGDSFLSHDPHDVIYDLRCQSDPLRVTKHMRAFGLACCMSTERQMALLMSDGRLLIWSLMTVDHAPSSTSNVHTQMVLSPLYSPGIVPGVTNSDFEFLPPLSNSGGHQILPHPKISMADLICQTDVAGDPISTQPQQQGRGVILKFVLTGLSCGVASVPTIIRMCPPVTTRNLHKYKPLAALGSSTGLVQVYNLTTGSLWREYNIHTCSVRGIEWVSLTSFLSYSYPNPPSNGLVRNELLLLDLLTGRTIPLRGHKGDEAPIEAVKVSHLKQYFIVMLKEKPFEIWDLKNRTILREMPANFPIITALEWSPTHHKKRSAMSIQETVGSSSLLDASGSSHILDGSGDSKMSQVTATREHFFFAESNRMLHHFWVEGSLVKEGSRLPSDSGLGSITCMTWKGETLVMGDADGMLGVWDLKARVSRNYPTHRSSIKKVKFAPGKGNLKILCLWSEGLDIWDIKEVRGTSSMKVTKEQTKLIDADWAASDKPIVVSSDGCIRVCDIKLKTTCSPMDYAEFADPVFCPYLLSPKAALAMKYTMQHQPWNDEYTLQLSKEYFHEPAWLANLPTAADDDSVIDSVLDSETEEEPERCETPEDENFIKAVNDQFDIMPQKMKDYLPVCPYGTAQRCLLAAQLFGDEAETTFWTVALQYLKAEKARLNCPIHKSTPDNPGAGYHSDPFQGEVPGALPSNNRSLLMDTREEEVVTSCSCIKEPLLDTCYDTLCDSKSYQKYQLERLSLHDSKRSTHEQTMKCAENLILLGQFDRAVQLYLETEAENDSYYLDSILACLVATVKSTGASQSTIKLVATSLIANNKLSEGVQLLCLINKGIDACRYLITYGEWNQAVWLAKATLPFSEYSVVLRRYIDYLCSPAVNQKTKAILVLLSIGQFQQVLEVLMSMHYYDRAGMFAEACTEFDVLPDTEEIRTLLEKVYLEYARYLLALGNRKAYGYYCNKAAEKAQKVNQDLEWMED